MTYLSKIKILKFVLDTFSCYNDVNIIMYNLSMFVKIVQLLFIWLTVCMLTCTGQNGPKLTPPFI